MKQLSHYLSLCSSPGASRTAHHIVVLPCKGKLARVRRRRAGARSSAARGRALCARAVPLRRRARSLLLVD